MSLDEAYIDITDYLLLHPDANAWDSVQVFHLAFLPFLKDNITGFKHVHMSILILFI